jgi:hypothetical protein
MGRLLPRFRFIGLVERVTAGQGRHIVTVQSSRTGFLWIILGFIAYGVVAICFCRLVSFRFGIILRGGLAAHTSSEAYMAERCADAFVRKATLLA